jgi:hypothetical protein
MARARPRHAAGDLGDAQRRRTAQAHCIELHQHDVADESFRQIGVFAQRKSHVVKHGQVGEQGAKLEQHAQAPPQGVHAGLVRSIHPLPVETHLARVWRSAATDQAQQGGLATAGAAQQGCDLASTEDQREVGEDLPTGVVAKADTVDLDQGIGAQAARPRARVGWESKLRVFSHARPARLR